MNFLHVATSLQAIATLLLVNTTTYKGAVVGSICVDGPYCLLQSPTGSFKKRGTSQSGDSSPCSESPLTSDKVRCDDDS